MAPVLAAVAIDLALVAGLWRETVITLTLRAQRPREACSGDTVPEMEGKRDREREMEEERDDETIREREKGRIQSEGREERMRDTRGQKRKKIERDV